MARAVESLGDQHITHLFLPWAAEQAEFPWALLWQQKPRVPYLGHSIVLPLELSPHTACYRVWLLDGRLGFS